MLNYTLVVDETADLDPRWLRLHPEVVVNPMPLSINGELHDEFTPDTFYPYLIELRKRRQATNVKTSGNASIAEKNFRRLFEAGQPFIYLGMTGGLSSACRDNISTIERLRKKYPDVPVGYIDSHCIAPGYRLLVERIVMRDIQFGDVLSFITRERDSIGHLFSFDDFEQAVAGGRVRKMEGWLGQSLKIFPYMRFDYVGEGNGMDDAKRLAVTAKTHGTKTLLKKFAEEVSQRIATAEQREADPSKKLIIVSHAYCPEKVEFMRTKLEEMLPDNDFIIETGRIGPVVGAHVGETTFAVFFTTCEPSTELKPTWAKYQP